MIIWKGKGILIPVAAVFGFFAGQIFDFFAGAFLDSEFGFGFGVIFAGFAVLFLRRLLEPKSGEAGGRHSLFFLPAGFWGAALVVVGMYSIYGDASENFGSDEDSRITSADRSSSTTERSRTRFNKELSEAERLIMSDRAGVVHGNTKFARECALAFSESAKEFRELGIEGAEEGGISFTGGEMVTYCFHQDDRMVFLVHVPKIRNFAPSAKKFMMEAAWVSAQLASGLADPPPDKIAVGTRGVMLYDKGWVGERSSDVEGDPFAGVQRKSSDDEAITAMLGKYFSGDIPEPEKSPFVKAATGNNSADKVPAASTHEAVAAAPATDEGSPEDFSLPSPQRKWTSTDKREFTGVLRSFVDGGFSKAEFVDETGEVFKVPTAKFAVSDRKLLNAYFKAQRKSRSK